MSIGQFRGSSDEPICQAYPPDPINIALEVYARLPREIRNRVYTYCVQGPCDNEVIVRRALGTKNKCAFLIRRRTTSEHSYHWIEDPIASLIDARYLGVEVAREMLEAYYWIRVFKFSQYDSPLLESFLRTDKFGLSMFAADYARHLHLTLQPTEYVAPWSQKGLSAFQKCLTTIEALTNIHTARLQVVFNIDLIECIDHQATCCNDASIASRDVEYVVKSMKAKGLRAKIAYRRWED